MAYFHLRLEPPRKTFPFDASETERTAMSVHADYWRDKAANGVAIVAGPVFEGEGAWGMVVVEVEDADTARSIADSDPVIKAGLGFRIDVAPMPSLILRRGQS